LPCIGEQLLQPGQADRVLADLRHEPKAASTDDPSADFGSAAVPVRGLSELFKVHAFTASEPA
jgi:hypothetical protein